MQAALAFQEGKYDVARELYAGIITNNPDCPAAVRVGLGMALFRLGHVEAATAAFKRAIQLDVRCQCVALCVRFVFV